MKIILLASSKTVFPSLHFLQNQQMLAGIICPERSTEDILQIQEWANTKAVPVSLITEKTLSSAISEMIRTTAAGLVLAYTFPFKIPVSLFELVKYGFYNVHYSLLPKYRGPAPIFWQLKNGDQNSGITIHKMTGQFDDGPIVSQLLVPVLAGENEGLLNSRLSHLTAGLLKELADKDFTSTSPQTVHTKEDSSYFGRPAEQDICINWESQTSIEIENLINACNPYCNGAVTFFRGQPLRILEVNPTDSAGAAPAAAGHIVHADQQYGLFVMCADQNILRINIIKMNEGIFTGFKLSAIGIKAGDKFESPGIATLA